MVLGRASRTAARLVGSCGANAEPWAPEVGLEGPGMSPSHSEHPRLPTPKETVMNHTQGYFQTLTPTVDLFPLPL